MSKLPSRLSARGRTPVFWEQSLRQIGGGSLTGRILAMGQLRTNRGLEKYRTLDSYALVYLISGSGMYESPATGSHPLRAGDAILVFPGDPHRYQPAAKSGWQELYVLFEGRVFDLWREDGFLQPAQPIFHASPIPGWSARILGLLPGGRSRLTKNQSLRAVLAMQTLLAELIHLQEPHHPSTEDPWIEQAVAALEALPYPGLDSVAHPFGLSGDTFRKRFRALSGISVTAFRRRHLMARTKTLLAEGRLRHHEIADALGFYDAAHFSRFLKKTVGTRPKVRPRRAVT